VHVIHEVPDYTPPTEKLEAAKAHARSYAAEQRRMKLNRGETVARTLAKLGSASHA
jgi:hypothetical protein